MESVFSVMISQNISRREFLRATSIGIAAAAAPNWVSLLPRPADHTSATHCILLLLAGGPSQLDTWDMKPDAISTVRGPFHPINTNVIGIQISEIFPRMAKHADKFALVRSVHSDTKPLHHLGCQEIQTGRVFTREVEVPHCGAVVSRCLRSARSDVPGHVVLFRSAHDADAILPFGRSADRLASSYARTLVSDLSLCALTDLNEDPDRANTRYLSGALNLEQEPQWIREQYGAHEFGRACLVARRLVERGITFVTVNLFADATGASAWDIHGSPPFPGISSYRDHIGPMFDRAYSALLEDLQSRGLLQTVLVLAVGEFGRTPRINSHGGRDHWTGCWTAVFAGGGIRGGQIVGASDAIGCEPHERAVTPAQVVASVYHGLGVPADARYPEQVGASIGMELGAEPILELF